MGNTLVDADVVKSTKAFVDAAEENPRGKNIQPGTYKLRKQMRAADAVTLLLDPKSPGHATDHHPRGQDRQADVRHPVQGDDIPVADFEAAAKDPEALGVPDFWFNRDGRQEGRPSRSRASCSRTRTSSSPSATADEILEDDGRSTS